MFPISQFPISQCEIGHLNGADFVSGIYYFSHRETASRRLSPWGEGSRNVHNCDFRGENCHFRGKQIYCHFRGRRKEYALGQFLRIHRENAKLFAKMCGQLRNLMLGSKKLVND